MTHMLFKSLWETVMMVGVSSLFSLVLGLPIAILLVTSRAGGIRPNPWLYQGLGAFVNAARSIPYIILTVLLMPVTRVLVGSSIGTWAATLPLTIAGSLLIARVVEDCLRSVPQGLVEVGLAAGATHTQIVRTILLSEALPSMIGGVTTVVVNIIGFSAMAGAVGGGGLGDLAIRYGYQRYDITLTLVIVAILIGMVQSVQMVGNYLVRRCAR